MHIVLRHCL